MPEITLTYRTCTYCTLVIPDGADQINHLSGQIVAQQQAEVFDALDFCSTDHLTAWLGELTPVIAVANLEALPVVPRVEADPVAVAVDAEVPAETTG